MLWPSVFKLNILHIRSYSFGCGCGVVTYCVHPANGRLSVRFPAATISYVKEGNGSHLLYIVQRGCGHYYDVEARCSIFTNARFLIKMKERVSKLTYTTLQHCLRMLYTMNGNSKHKRRAIGQKRDINCSSKGSNQHFLSKCTSTHYVLHIYKVSRNSVKRFQRSCANKKIRTDGLTDWLTNGSKTYYTLCNLLRWE